MSCSALALAAGETLAGTATVARRWLVVEVGGAWGRDAVADTDLPHAVRSRLVAWLAEEHDSRVLFARRPDRRGPETILFAARWTESGGELRGLVLRSLEAVAEADLGRGDALAGPLYLVCTHGRRDPCCARNGVPAYEALAAHAPGELVWQSSHQGGHRFAPNVLVLPAGISLGRVGPAEAAGVAADVAAGRIPLEHFRGRTIHAPEAQAAEAEVRRRLGLRGLEDVHVLDVTDGRVRLATPTAILDVEVAATAGALRPESCGAEPAPATVYTVRW